MIVGFLCNNKKRIASKKALPEWQSLFFVLGKGIEPLCQD